MERQPYARFRRHRNHGFQEIRDVGPHLFERVHALIRQRRQILYAVVVERRQPRARPSGFLVVTLDNAVRVKVVLDYGETGTASRADRRPHFLDLLVAARPSVDGVGKSADHHIAQGEPAGLERVHDGANLAFLPGNLRPAHQHVVHPELFHAPHAGRIEMARREAAGAAFQADLGRIPAFRAQSGDLCTWGCLLG